jgi:3-hydroxyacyl-[acyl-carrier-protein] dehydratase
MMDIREIEQILPHRYPFLLVDRVVEVVPGQKLIAYKNVSINEPFFSGHFPGHPVMPGVLIVEALAQAAALLAIKSGGNAHDKLIYLAAIDNARFRKPVVPGDRLQLEVEIVKHKGAIWKQKGLATVDGARVAEAEFLATAVDKNAAPSGDES